MSAQISLECTRPLVISEDETKEKRLQDIKAKVDSYGSPLSHKQTVSLLKIDERIERLSKRIIGEDLLPLLKK
ncbi:hypothetical protein RO3G_16004 [Rhizopus delemar RA 99-880]|uniref:Uncharacterized protein n=1 Tax=Rhizopus delemar (strain RA 99-880 / ATCC MYA-4621 / FGSC 9543 / NRRL 43880) TaxID=246409 RepID=I1CS63_RHIO9|nr:hypothetical protein RO3G_16004 [Rhizopus delemar RA 99-880]|eukprot:EIE91293.1 hypothetical protein RO3G_16004 [Rhizopus delemar RA 99-880]